MNSTNSKSYWTASNGSYYQKLKNKLCFEYQKHSSSKLILKISSHYSKAVSYMRLYATKYSNSI